MIVLPGVVSRCFGQRSVKPVCHSPPPSSRNPPDPPPATTHLQTRVRPTRAKSQTTLLLKLHLPHTFLVSDGRALQRFRCSFWVLVQRGGVCWWRSSHDSSSWCATNAPPSRTIEPPWSHQQCGGCASVGFKHGATMQCETTPD